MEPPEMAILNPLYCGGLCDPVTCSPASVPQYAMAKECTGVGTSPTSITWAPAATIPRFTASASSLLLRRLSRPSASTGLSFSSRRRTSVVKARPMDSATSGVTSLPTTPRMSYCRKMCGLTIRLASGVTGSEKGSGAPRRKAARRPRSLRRSALAHHGDRLDLDGHVAREAGGLHGGARRLVVAEPAAVDLVHGGEVAHVAQEDGGLHHGGEVGAGGLEHALHVRHHPLRLRGDVALHQLHRGRVERDLPRGEHQAVHHHPLAVGADGGGRLVRLYRPQLCHA